jgi:hypothetical protein
MENSSPVPISVHQAENPAIKAKRLLEELNSPLLLLASQLPERSYPHRSDSLSLSSLAAEIEKISRSRFSLARDQKLINNELSRYTRLQLIHHECQHYSWLSIAQLETLGGGKECCCYCSDSPLSLQHIGYELTSIQRYVELISYGQTRFSQLNTIDYADLSDIFIFQCLSSSCKKLEYDAPFSWFLETPWRGCPSCKAKIYGKDRY